MTTPTTVHFDYTTILLSVLSEDLFDGFYVFIYLLSPATASLAALGLRQWIFVKFTASFLLLPNLSRVPPDTWHCIVIVNLHISENIQNVDAIKGSHWFDGFSAIRRRFALPGNDFVFNESIQETLRD